MSRTENVIVASYRNHDDANAAIRELEQTALSDKQVGLLVRDDGHGTRFKSLRQSSGGHDESKVGTGAAAGVAVGAGGGALWALGIAAGLLPAIGPVVGGGILGAVLASAGTGAVAGGIVGSLIGLGMSEEDATFASTEFDGGATVVVVKDAPDRAEVLRILERNHPILAPSIRTRDSRPAESHYPL